MRGDPDPEVLPPQIVVGTRPACSARAAKLSL